MELTPGILKSVDSSIHQNSYYWPKTEFWVTKYKGDPVMLDGGKGYYTSEKAANKAVYNFVYLIFWQGETSQSAKRQIKERTGYEVDYSATIKILPQYGLTARFDTPESKKMFKDIAENLIKEKIITVEKVFEI